MKRAVNRLMLAGSYRDYLVHNGNSNIVMRFPRGSRSRTARRAGVDVKSTMVDLRESRVNHRDVGQERF